MMFQNMSCLNRKVYLNGGLNSMTLRHLEPIVIKIKNFCKTGQNYC